MCSAVQKQPLDSRIKDKNAEKGKTAYSQASCSTFLFDYLLETQVDIYLLKVNNGNTRTRCEMCSKLKIKTPEQRHWRRSSVFIVNFEHISHLVLVFLVLTLNM